MDFYRVRVCSVAMDWREYTRFALSMKKKLAPNHLLALIAIARKSQTCTHIHVEIMCSHIADNGKIREKEIVVVKSVKNYR